MVERLDEKTKLLLILVIIGTGKLIEQTINLTRQ